VVVVRDMILPNCVWVAGRTAGAVRKAAVACLWTLVRSPALLTADQVPRLVVVVTVVVRGAQKP